MGFSRVIATLVMAVVFLSGIQAWSRQKPGTEESSKSPDKAAADTKAQDRERLVRLESMRRAAEKYQVVLDNPAKDVLRLQAEPVLRWTNPVRGTTDGAVFLWLVNGRPEMAAGIYKWGAGVNVPNMEHELCSLALGKLTADREDQTVWQPATAGIELKPVPNAAKPADSAGRRLVQLRAMANEFSAFQNDVAAPNEQLRLLPAPIYRYEKTGDELLDGGLFAFVQATDPEVLLLIEARRGESGPQWQFALARMTSRALRATHEGQEIWKAANCWNEVTDRKGTYTAFFRLLEGE